LQTLLKTYGEIRLMLADFLQRAPFTRLPDLCRYLKSVGLQAERARLNPTKDLQKVD